MLYKAAVNFKVYAQKLAGHEGKAIPANWQVSQCRSHLLRSGAKPDFSDYNLMFILFRSNSLWSRLDTCILCSADPGTNEFMFCTQVVQRETSYTTSEESPGITNIEH